MRRALLALAICASLSACAGSTAVTPAQSTQQALSQGLVAQSAPSVGLLTEPLKDVLSRLHHRVKNNVACTTVVTSIVTTTAAHVGGGDHLALDFSTSPCAIGVYIGASNAGAHLDHTTINGGYGIGVFVDTTNGVHIDHTQVTGGAGDGLAFFDATAASMDHTTTDMTFSGIVDVSTGPPTDITIDHTASTRYTANGFIFAGATANFAVVSISHSTATSQTGAFAGFSFGDANTKQVEQNVASGNTYDFDFCPMGTGINTAALLTQHHNIFTTFNSCP